MPVQVSCKFDGDPVKNELRRYLVHIFSIIRLRKKKIALKSKLLLGALSNLSPKSLSYI